MFSLLIPTYNFDCTQLVTNLAQQCAALKERDSNFDFEIIVGDDGSTDERTKEVNRRINHLPGCTFWESPHNLGRSRLRNALIEQSRFPYLLLMDADAAVCTPDFVARYWEMRQAADVVNGSLRNLDSPCPRGCELRYCYEQAAERQRTQADHFRDNPFLHFTAFNVLINRQRLGALRFDPRCREYGYEDALLGLVMKEQGLTLVHIDNPLIHTGLDTSREFLMKTEAAMRTLTRLTGTMQEANGVARLYDRLAKWRLAGVLRGVFRLVRPLLRRNLLGRRPNLFLFQLYKLGYYASLRPHHLQGMR